MTILVPRYSEGGSLLWSDLPWIGTIGADDKPMLVTQGRGVLNVCLSAGKLQETGLSSTGIALKDQDMSGIQSQTQTDERAKAWTNYWQTGNLHSCLVTRSEGEEDVPVHDHDWRQFFGALEDGARILDVGTGNGAVAQLAYETGKQGDKHFEVHGVDAAEIAPASPVGTTTTSLEFHSGTPMERLPFDDGTFDCVVSQYALEYSDMEASFEAIARVLKPRGKMRFILHSADSTPVLSSKKELEVLQEIIDDIGVIRCLRNMLVARTEKPAKVGLADRKVVKALKKLEAIIQGDNAIMHHANFFRVGVELYNHRLSPARAEMLQRLAKMDEDYSRVRERLGQMVSAALDTGKFEVLQDYVSSQGFEATKTDHLSSNDGIVGWLIELKNSRKNVR